MDAPLAACTAESPVPEARGRIEPDPARAVVAHLASFLTAIRGILCEIEGGLPDSPDEALMMEGEIATDVPAALRATISCVVADDIEPAIASLARASRTTAEELKREFHELAAEV